MQCFCMITVYYICLRIYIYIYVYICMYIYIYIWGEVNEGKKWCPIFQQKYVYLDGMKSVILLK